jgi:hypothetical protein
VPEYLAASPCVARAQDEPSEQGGDGVAIAVFG